jgi:hypothetical protein
MSASGRSEAPRLLQGMAREPRKLQAILKREIAELDDAKGDTH